MTSGIFLCKETFRLFEIIDGHFRFNPVFQIVEQARFEIVVNTTEKTKQFIETFFFMKTKIKICGKLQNGIGLGQDRGK